MTPGIRESSRGPWGATRRNRTTATPCKCVPFQGWARVDDGVVWLSQRSSRSRSSGFPSYDPAGSSTKWEFSQHTWGEPRNRAVSPASSEAMRLSQRRRGDAGREAGRRLEPNPQRGKARTSGGVRKGAQQGIITYKHEPARMKGGVRDIVRSEARSRKGNT